MGRRVRLGNPRIIHESPKGAGGLQLSHDASNQTPTHVHALDLLLSSSRAAHKPIAIARIFEKTLNGRGWATTVLWQALLN